MILQFLYLGEATFYHEKMNEFLNVAKNLDIMEIGKNVVDESDDLNFNSDLDKEKPVECDKNQSKIELATGTRMGTSSLMGTLPVCCMLIRWEHRKGI